MYCKSDRSTWRERSIPSKKKIIKIYIYILSFSAFTKEEIVRHFTADNGFDEQIHGCFHFIRVRRILLYRKQDPLKWDLTCVIELRQNELIIQYKNKKKRLPKLSQGESLCRAFKFGSDLASTKTASRFSRRLWRRAIPDWVPGTPPIVFSLTRRLVLSHA